MQDDFDSGYGTDQLFYQPQYGALAAFSTLGTSDYHSLQVVFRKAMSRDFSFDFNYTAAHSLDTASGRQSGTSFASPFVTNPFNLNVNRANSDFDLRHQVNANFIYEIPVGKGKRLLADAPGLVNQILGGWQVTGIYRFHTGLPAPSAYDANQWATNWNAQSWGVPIRKIVSTPTRTGDPNLFSDPVVAYKSYRNAYPGEQGVRNDLRYPKYQVLDTGLYKSFPLPKEGWVVKFRWEVFNLTNTQYFTSLPSLNRRLSQDPWASGGPDADFGKFSGIQGSPRIMQFALRFEF
jgi:hypothetical protein